MRLLALCLFAAVMVGCTTTKTIEITTRPPGAAVDIDGRRQGTTPLSYQFIWENDTDIHYVVVNLAGYKEQTLPLARSYDKNDLAFELRPLTRSLSILVKPVPAIISINGKKLNSEPVSGINTNDLEFTQDAKGKWTTYKITAERTGFKTATAEASWLDKDRNYTLSLDPMEKEITVTTNPPGATVYFDDESQPLGQSPVTVTRKFSYDTDSESYVKHKLRASLAGYPDQSQEISWDDAHSDYAIDMIPLTKTVKIHTTPPGGTVTIDGHALTQDSSGNSIAPNLSFPPIDGKGTLKSYPAQVTKKTADAEWYPQNIAINWDEGKTDYTIPLREVRTMKLPLLTLAITRGTNSWDIAPKTEETIAGKDVAEASGAEVQRLTPNEIRGQTIDSLAISPDGKWLLFSVLVEKPEFHTLIFKMRADGSASPVQVNDGKSLDVTPAFSPDGDQILFGSDRAGKLSIWGISAEGALGAQQYTTGDTTDIWPSMDSSPKPRLFCESFTDRLPRPRIFSRPVDMISRTDLGIDGGMQPRINAKNDTVLYCAYNEKTRKRDIFKVGDRGGQPLDLTNTPDIDEYDAAWDRDGARIAFVSDRGLDQDKHPNADIWVMDLIDPAATPIQVTSNPSQDDHPVWDPSGRAIYFRSNRGGEWGIWKIVLK